MYRIYQKHLLLNGDLHLEPSLTPALNDFKKSSALFYRRIVEWDVEESNFYYIIQDKALTEDDLRSKDRNALRKSQKNLTFQKVELDVLVEKGLQLYLTLPADGDTELSSNSFKKYLSARSQNQDYWIVYNEQNECVGFAVCTVFNESVDLSILRVSREDKSNAVYGLVFKLNDFYIRQQGKMYINDGFKSYLHGAGFQDWLCKKLGYRRCYVNVKIYSKIPLNIIQALLSVYSSGSKLKSLKAYLKDYSLAKK